jgi:hypothetical protein
MKRRILAVPLCRYSVRCSIARRESAGASDESLQVSNLALVLEKLADNLAEHTAH